MYQLCNSKKWMPWKTDIKILPCLLESKCFVGNDCISVAPGTVLHTEWVVKKCLSVHSETFCVDNSGSIKTNFLEHEMG